MVAEAWAGLVASRTAQEQRQRRWMFLAERKQHVEPSDPEMLVGEANSESAYWQMLAELVLAELVQQLAEKQL